MQRISDREVILTDDEMAISDRVERLLDQGHNFDTAFAVIEASLLGHALTPELKDWLS